MSAPSIIPKIAALGAAALGGLLLKDRAVHWQNELERIDTELVEEDYLHHAKEAMYDYSGNDTLTALKHKIFNPVNWHFITRPWTYLKGYANMAVENAIPLGLLLVGLSYGFGSSPMKVLGAVGRGIAAVGGPIFRGLGQLFGAAGSVMGPTISNFFRNFKFPSLGPQGVLAVGAAAFMALYGMHRFKRELTGENQDQFYKALGPGGH